MEELKKLLVDIDEELQNTVIKEIENGTTDDMNTIDLYNFISLTCIAYVGKEPAFDKIASHFALKILYNKVDINNYYNVLQNIIKLNVLSDDYVNYCNNNISFINSILNIENDKLLDFFGIKTMEKMYFIKSEQGNILETPQHVFLRVAIQININEPIETQNNCVLETYQSLSNLLYTHGTPTIINSGNKYPQLSSCYLLQCPDSTEGITNTFAQMAKISRWAGGIGVNISDIRSKNSKIKSNNGHSSGIVPICRVFESVGRCFNQCLTPESIVYGVDCKQIKDINVNDLVYTHDGSLKRVNKIYKNNISKNIYKIENMFSFEGITLTGEHNIFVLEESHNNLRVIEMNVEKIFKSLKNQYINHYLIYPKLKTNNNVYNYFDKNECIFIGLFLSKGYIDIVNVNIILFIDKDDYLCNDIENYCFNNKLRFNYIDNMFIIYDIPDIIYDLHKDDEKTLDYVFSLSQTEILYVIKGLISNGFETIDRMFAYNVNLLCLMNDIYVYCNKETINNEIKYVIDVNKISNYDFNKMTFKSQNEYMTKINNKMNCENIDFENFNVVEIENITQKYYNGYVYDLSIDENHNYLTSIGLVHNSGKRKGSIAIYLEPWHADIEDFCDLKRINGNELERTRDLFIGLWIPDLFMKCVENNDDWYLMNPDICRGLTDTYGDEFEELYNKYISEGKYIKVIKANILFDKILESQFETGFPYMLYKDSVNKKSNQMNIGVIKNSNLCTEIVEVSNENEIAVCNLASLSLSKCVKIINGKSFFDFDLLGNVVRLAVRNLNKIIDINYYPTIETSNSNFKHRPIGVGVQGLIDTYFMMNYKFDSIEANNLNKKIFECIYYNSLFESNKLALKFGKYETFDNSPFSQGLLQFHLWNKSVDDLYIKGYPSFNWNELIDDIKIVGTRNSLTTAVMPTATTSQVLGNYECIEPFASNILSRSTNNRDFIVINKYLVDELKNLNLWNSSIYNELIYADGSVQQLDIPQYLKDKYKTAYELKQIEILKQSIGRSPFIDQTQSLNIFNADDWDEDNFEKLKKCHMYGWKNGLKTGMYYLRSKPASSAGKFGIDPELKLIFDNKYINNKNKNNNNIVCNDEVCTMCSA